MNRISELREMLSGILVWNKSRLDCFIHMLLALFKVRTVNLREIAVAFGGSAAVDSSYRRIKRFFAQFEFDKEVIARWLYQLFFTTDKKVYLTIDRTNWFWGKAKINILTLGIAYEGIAIPLFWQCLDKAGNATAEEHIGIIERFIQTVGKENIAGILGDREFASGKLFKHLNKQKIGFYIRIKEGSLVCMNKKKLWKAQKIFKDVNPNTHQAFGMVVWIFGAQVYLAGSRSARGELMIVATNQCPKNAIAIYLRRWEIECLFASLKTRGFRLEETHLTILERIEKLMVLLAIGLAWAHKMGEWQATQKPIRINKHKDSRRPQYSYFRYGLDCIREVLFSLTKTSNAFFSQLAQMLWIEPGNLLKIPSQEAIT